MGDQRHTAAPGDLADPFDVIVVGGGSAGCVLASRLSEDPDCRVLLCEAGQDTPPGQVPEAILDSFAGFAYLNPGYIWNDLRATTEPVSQGRTAPKRKYEQARVLGGGSSINGQLAGRGSPGDYDEWQARGADGWNWDAVLPYFRKLERDMDFGGPLHGKEGPIAVSRLFQPLWPEHAHAMARALDAAGYDYIADQNGDFLDGYYPVAITNVFDRRVTAAIGYLGSTVRARPNLTLLTETAVDGLVIEGTTCTGVRLRLDGAERVVRARTTVLSAGAIFTPAMLLRAGIGPADQTGAMGIPVVADLPGVGRRLTDHPSVAVAGFVLPHARINGRTRRHLMLGLRFSSGLDGAPPGDMAASIATKSAWHAVGDQLATVNIWVNKTYSEDGTVALASPRAGDMPKVDFNLLSDSRDMERLKSAFRMLAGVVRSAPMEGVVTDVFPASYSDKVRQVAAITPRNKLLTSVLARLLDGPAPLRRRLIDRLIVEGAPMDRLLADDAALEDFIRHAAVGVWHASCSCRMGADDDPDAVLDARGRVRGVAGLRVADASAFPSIPCANINLPTIMLAERMSDLIAHDLKQADAAPVAAKVKAGICKETA